MFTDKISLWIFFSVPFLFPSIWTLTAHIPGTLGKSHVSLLFFSILGFLCVILWTFSIDQFNNLILSNPFLNLSILFLIPHTYFSVISYGFCFYIMSKSLVKILIHFCVYLSLFFFSILITITTKSAKVIFWIICQTCFLEFYYLVYFLLVLAILYYLLACLVSFNCMQHISDKRTFEGPDGIFHHLSISPIRQKQ